MRPKKASALRYLLLKHMWLLRRQCAPGIHGEAARALKVVYNEDAITISWKANQQDFSRHLLASHFKLYLRGDLGPTVEESCHAHAFNKKQAHALASEILGIPDRICPPEHAALSTPLAAWPWLVLGAAVVGFFADRSWLPALFAALVAVESRFWRFDAAYVVFGLILLALDKTGTVSLIVNTWMSLLAFLDNDRKIRGLKCLTHLALALASFYIMCCNIHGHEPSMSMAAIAAVNIPLLAVLLFFYQTGTMTVLLAPVLSIGFACVGLLSSSVALSAATLVCLFLRMQNRNQSQEEL
jgi:hypothetical protein